jgi:hypothetical protein
MQWSTRFGLLLVIFFFLVALGSAIVVYLDGGGYYMFASPAFITIVMVGSYAWNIRSGWREWQHWGPETIHFDDDGVTWETNRASSRIAWSSFTRFVDRKETYILLATKRTSVIILKRAIPHDVKDRLHDMIASHVVSRHHTGTDTAC